MRGTSEGEEARFDGARPWLVYSRPPQGEGSRMEIVWLGRSCLRLRSAGAALITDPYEGWTAPGAVQDADIVTLSGERPDLARPDLVGGRPRVLRGPGEYEIAGFYITGIGTRRPDPDGGRGEVNTIFRMRAEGLTLCHLGVLGEMPPQRLIQELDSTDVLFIPAGGARAIGAARAAELVNLVRPRIAVPLHAEDGADQIDAFLGEMGVSEAAPQPRLDVTPSSLPRDMRVAVLRPVSETSA